MSMVSTYTGPGELRVTGLTVVHRAQLAYEVRQMMNLFVGRIERK